MNPNAPTPAMASVRSSAYRLTNLAADPSNRLLWRHSPRRLAAEELRDAMLALGLKQIKGDRATMTVVFGPHRVELAKDFTPELEFVRVKEEIDKSAIRDALKAGREIPGASLVQEPYLKVSL